MTYEQTLSWMFAQLPMYQQRGAAAMNAKLDNIRALSEALGHPEQQFRSIHVAGTNGKGSSSHMLASILQEAGYKVGLYTSPHLKDFRERIRINGEMIPESSVIGFIDSHRDFLEQHRLSFFEMSVGMAFDYFAREAVDIAVIEVGLGGRLDSTNIITPEVSLITNIGMDHTEMLGETLQAITREKAGIIKDGVPVVISEWQEETAPVFETIATERHAPLYWAQEIVEKNYQGALLGSYQQQNIRGVVATIRQLRNFEISESQIERGLLKVVTNTGLLGRWQVVQEAPKIILDTAHNREGLALTMAQLERETYDRLHLVLGFVREKRLAPILELLPRHANYYFCRPDIPRGLEVEQLATSAREVGLEGTAFGSVSAALQAARKEAQPGDVIYVGGSTFTVAEAL